MRGIFIYLKVSIRMDWSDLRKTVENNKWTTDADMEISEDVVRFIRSLIVHCIIFIPLHTQCFQRSVVAYYLYRKINIPVNIMCGVRTHPYAMHCWVEYNDSVLFDSPRHSNEYKSKKFPLDEMAKL